MSQTQNKSNIVEIAETIKRGDVPSTQLIQAELQPTKQFLSEHEKATNSMEMEKAYHESRMFLEAFEQLLVEKNVADKMQKLVESAKRVNENTELVNNANTMWRDSRLFALALKDIIPDLIKSKSFRQGILDLFRLVRDIFNMKEKEVKGKDKLEQAFVENKPEKVGQLVEDAKDAAQDIKSGDIPEEQKQRFREDMKVLLRALNKQSSTSFAFQKLLKLWDMLSAELTNQLIREKVDKDIQDVEDAARDLIEVFTGRKLDEFIKKLQKANDTIQKDQTLQNFLKDFRNYIRKGLENPESLESDQFINEGDELIKRGRSLADKYSHDKTLDELFDESQGLIDAIKTDELVENLRYRAGKVADAFTYTDIAGNTHLDTDLISQMRADLVPFLYDQVKEVPLPGINIQNDEKFEYLVIEDLKVKLEDIVPDKISIHSRNDTDITPKDFENDINSDTVIRFKMDGIRPEFHNFQFRFKRRGLVTWQEEGRANLKITGKGVNVYMEFGVELDDQKRVLLSANAQVKVAVDGVSLDVIESEHKLLLNMISTVFAPTIKKDLEETLKRRFEEMGNEWAKIINKRILSAVSIGKIGTTVQHAVAKNVPILGETILESKTMDVPLVGTVNKTTVKHNP